MRNLRAALAVRVPRQAFGRVKCIPLWVWPPFTPVPAWIKLTSILHLNLASPAPTLLFLCERLLQASHLNVATCRSRPVWLCWSSLLGRAPCSHNRDTTVGFGCRKCHVQTQICIGHPTAPASAPGTALQLPESLIGFPCGCKRKPF